MMALEALWAPEHLDRVLATPDLFRRLGRIYRQIPQTTCRQRAYCCRDCPPVYLVEFANMLQAVQEAGAEEYIRLVHRSLEYFFFSAVEPALRCPFLSEQQCIIYGRRPRLCRVFGLYDQDEDLVEGARRLEEQVAARQQVLTQTYAVHGVKVSLRPPLPLCPYVRSQNGKGISLSRKARAASRQQVLQMESKVVGTQAGTTGQTFLPFTTHLAFFLFGPSRAQSLQIGVLQTYQRDREAARAQVHSLL
jgi:Fe-S-cluster containining protein